MNKEYGTKTRLIRLFRLLAESSFHYTRKELSHKYGVDLSTIKGDFRAFQDAGFNLIRDERHRYAFVEDKPFKKLKDLLHFSEADQLMLYHAIDQLDGASERGRQLKAKLGSIYDFKKLGFSYLRKPHLDKIDALLQSLAEKRQVILKDYRSTNRQADRRVEAFHIKPADDMIQAYDLDDRRVKSFRLSRILRIEPTENLWQHEGSHNILATDPFHIVDKAQVMVHLKLGLGAYNELIERFPICKAYTQATEDPNTYDFQCLVNHEFIGLSNFILGYYHKGIKVVFPESLKEKLREMKENMRFE